MRFRMGKTWFVRLQKIGISLASMVKTLQHEGRRVLVELGNLEIMKEVTKGGPVLAEIQEVLQCYW